MGNWISKQRELKILFQGLDGAGKTSLLYRQVLGGNSNLGILSGFGMETIQVHNTSLFCYDLGYRLKGRVIVREYMKSSHGVVYLIDSTDRGKLDEALDELVKCVLLEDQIPDLVVMVLVNKQDIPGAMSALEIEEALKRKHTFSVNSEISHRHTVFVRPCSVKTMVGVGEAFAEFVGQIQLRQAGKAQHGLLLSAGENNDVNVKDAPVQDIPQCEGVEIVDSETSLRCMARMGVKNLCRDPLSFLKSIFSRQPG